MYELEYKVRADHDAVRTQLQALDPTDEGVVEQRDTYFNAPHRDFAATDEALRVRVERSDGTAVTKVTYKGPVLDTAAKTREERETTVGDATEFRTILEHLGFAPAATVEKRRHRYQIEEFTLTLDSVTGLGEFLELEAEATADSDLDALEHRATEVLEAVGATPAEHISRSYLGLLLDQRED